MRSWLDLVISYTVHAHIRCDDREDERGTELPRLGRRGGEDLHDRGLPQRGVLHHRGLGREDGDISTYCQGREVERVKHFCLMLSKVSNERAFS